MVRIFKPIQVLSALIFAAALLIPPALAQAATLNWSGLDARFYDGPIPPPGTTIESVPLDPAMSLTGAGPAYRVLYSTVDQHDQPAVSTGAVFLPPGPAPEGGFPVIAWAHGTVDSPRARMVRTSREVYAKSPILQLVLVKIYRENEICIYF